jgi:hypothetical protein
MSSIRKFNPLVMALLVCAGADFLRKVDVREVEADLQATMNELLSGTATVNTRFAAIEASTWQTFQALPKNEAGRLAPRAVRHIVHAYFAREHGWLIKGLEPHGMQTISSNVHDVSILQDKAPLLVENLLEARQAKRGLNFNDVVTMIAVLEQMMFDESMTLFQAAYRLNRLPQEEEIEESTLHKVLQSYLVLFGQGSKANLVDVELHQKLMERARARPEIEEFEHDAVLNYVFSRRHQANPFKARRYSFQMAAEIMEDLAQQYGKWQNSECRDMKAHLAELDPEGLGRVPLGLFYAQPAGATYHFAESQDYLRQIGALDETVPGNPQVYIANYVTGPSNCIASSAYYSVCCLSECDDILGDLERTVGAPRASADTLLSLIRNMSHANMEHNLADKLRTIASQNGGEVPLHGRLFAQWLHFAFPHECPFPSIVDSSSALSASQWMDGKSTASAEERKKHVESAPLQAAPTAEEFDINGRWSEHEVLPFHESHAGSFRIGSGAMRAMMQIVALCLVLRSALAAWRTSGVMSHSAKKKDDDFALGFRV